MEEKRRKNTSNLLRGIILGLGCLLFNPSTVDAQAFRGSIIAGPTFSQINGDSLVGFHKLGFFGGASVSRRISKSFFVQFDILYQQKGASSEIDTSTSGMTVPIQKTQINYIEIPLQLYWNFNTRLFMHTGPYYGILSSSNYDDGAIQVDNTNVYHSYDLGIIYGVEYALLDRLSMQGRFSTSLFNIAKFGASNQFNVNASLGLRYVVQTR
jgi:hypothetical protein